MTLSSRDPHLGQRIVLNASIAHNQLYRQSHIRFHPQAHVDATSYPHYTLRHGRPPHELGDVRPMARRSWRCALRTGGNVRLNIQPVLSTMRAFLLFVAPLGPRCFLYAGIAILAGVFVSVTHPTLISASFERAGLNRGTGYALVCALFWGLATVAGRGTMMGMPLRLAASLRITVGLICMTLILLVYEKLHRASLWPTAAQAHMTTAIFSLLL